MRTADRPSPPECVTSLLDIIPDAAYFIDTAGRVQYANETAARQEAGAIPVGADLARLPLTDPGGAALPYESSPFYRSAQQGETCRAVDLSIPGAGAPQALRVSSTPVREDGVLRGALVIVQPLHPPALVEPDLAQRNAALQALNDLAARLLRINTSQEVYETALDGILGIMGARRGAINLTDDVQREFHLVTHRGITAATQRNTDHMPYDLPTAHNTVRESGEIVIIHPDRAGQVGQLVLAEQAVQTAVLLPLCRGERVIGVISYLLDEYRECTPLEREILRTTATYVGAALERAQLYEAAEAERTRLARILEHLPVGVLIGEGAPEPQTIRFIFSNETVRRQYSRSVVAPGAGHETFTIYHPDGHPYADAELPLQSTLWTGRPAPDQELVFRYQNGTERVFLASAMLLQTGAATREAIVVTQEITARKQVEAALRQSEERFAKAFRSNPDPLNITRLADDLILDVNERWLEVTGYTREEVVGHTAVGLNLWVHPAERALIGSLLYEQGAVHEATVDFRMKSGAERHCLLSVELIELEGETCALSMVHDITERKRLEEQVQQQAATIQEEYERLATLVANINVALALLDAEGRIVLMNDAWLRNSPYTREDVLGRRPADLFDQPGLQNIQTAIEQVLAGGEPVQIREWHFPQGGGAAGIYVDGSVQPMRGPAGEITGVLTAAMDVTEKVLIRRQIEAQRALLETIVASLPVGIAYFDQEMRYVNMNSAWALFTGLDPAVAIGQPYYAQLPPAVQWPALHPRMLAGEVFDQENVPHAGPDGTPHYYDVRYRPVRDAGGAVTGLLTTSVDVTEKVLSQEEIENQRALLETIIEANPVGMAFFDRELRLLNCNAAWAAIVGLDPAKARGRLIYKLVPAMREQAAAHQQALAGEDVDLFNVPFQPPGDAEMHYYDLRYRPVHDVDSAITGLLIAAIDVTERHELDRQKDEFIALASHELKTPITAIKGYAQTGLRIVRELGDERLIRTLRIIDDQSNRLTRLINDLLDVSRMESGSLAFYQEPFDLRQLVHEVAGNLQLTAPGFVIDPHLPTTPTPINGDRQRLEQVVTNLVQNAIKYSGASRRVEVTMTRAGAEVITVVRDFGVGIPAEQQGRVFERFFRASNVSARHYSGLGLGLFISYGIVARHGGRMWIESTEGQGSAFYFALPLLSDEQ